MKFNWKDEYYRYRRYFFDLQKKAPPSKVRSFIWLSLTLFTISFFIVVAIRPTLVTIAKLNREIKDKKEASRKLQTKIDAIVQAQKEFSANAENMYLLDEALPKRNEFPRLAYFFEQNASLSGILLKSIKFENVGSSKVKVRKAEKSTNETNLLNFSLIVSGDYLRLKEFLQSLESSRRLLTVQKTQFGQTKTKEQQQELSLSINGVAYFEKGQK